MIILILLYMSIIDLKTKQVNSTSQLILLLFCMLNITSIIIPIILFLMFYILSIVFKNKMGGADYKILIILSITYGSNIFYIMFIASLVAIPFAIKFNKIPFVPFITLGVICQNFVT